MASLPKTHPFGLHHHRQQQHTTTPQHHRNIITTSPQQQHHPFSPLALHLLDPRCVALQPTQRNAQLHRHPAARRHLQQLALQLALQASLVQALHGAGLAADPVEVVCVCGMLLCGVLVRHEGKQ
jgi:hypothetical protein